jgi:serine/threonine protein kinase
MDKIAELFKGYRDGRFVIKSLLGEGGMANVWLAHDTLLDVTRAIKVLKFMVAANPALCERFLREARIMARLNHKNSVQVIDYGQVGDLPFLIMEHLSGGTVKDYLLDVGLLPSRIAVSMCCDVLSALDALHALDGGRFVHRDIKLGNILLDEKGVPKIGDFGIAHDDDDHMTKDAAQMGTPSYMAPELWIDAKKADGRTDLYAVAVVLYASLVGIDKLERSTGAAIRRREELRVGVPSVLMQIIFKGTEANQEQRYQSAKEMIWALRESESKLAEIPMDCKWPGWEPPRMSHVTMVPSDYPEQVVAMDGSGAVVSCSEPEVSTSITHGGLVESVVSEDSEPEPFVPVGNSETLFGLSLEGGDEPRFSKRRLWIIRLAVLVFSVSVSSITLWKLADTEVLVEPLPDPIAEVLPEPESEPELTPDSIIETTPFPKGEGVAFVPVEPDPVVKLHAPDSIIAPQPLPKEVVVITVEPEVPEDPLPAEPLTAHVSFTGANAVWLIGGVGKIALPADVPPDTYQVDADFGNGAFQAGNALIVEAGQNVSLTCSAGFASCDP